MPNVGDIVDLYVNPLDRATMLNLDGKSQIQAPELAGRLSPRPGVPQPQTHECNPHAATTPSPTRHPTLGEAIGHCRGTRRNQKLIIFLDTLASATEPTWSSA